MSQMRRGSLEFGGHSWPPVHTLSNAMKGTRTVLLLEWSTMVLFQPQVGSTNAFYSSLPCPPHPTLATWLNQDSLEVLEHWTTEDSRLLMGHIWVLLNIAFSGNKEWAVSHLQFWLYPGVLKFHFISPKGIHWDFLSLMSIKLVAVIKRFDVHAAGRYCGMTA